LAIIDHIRRLSSLLNPYITRNLRLTSYNYYSMAVITKHQTISILLSRPYNPVVFVSNGKRTMSTSFKPVPVRVYLNPDKEKELVVTENKGRTGIYR